MFTCMDNSWSRTCFDLAAVADAGNVVGAADVGDDVEVVADADAMIGVVAAVVAVLVVGQHGVVGLHDVVVVGVVHAEQLPQLLQPVVAGVVDVIADVADAVVEVVAAVAVVRKLVPRLLWMGQWVVVSSLDPEEGPSTLHNLEQHQLVASAVQVVLAVRVCCFQ